MPDAAQQKLAAMAATMRQNRFLVIGRAGMDFYADPPGVEAEHADRFTTALGGSSANIAVAISRQGGQASLLTTVSDDAVGRFVVNQLRRFGIATDFVRMVDGQKRTSLAVVETRLENCQSVIYRNRAADFEVSPDDVEAIDLTPFGAVVITGTCLAAEPSRSAVHGAIERARRNGLPVVLDLDYRPYTWPTQTDAGEICLQAARQCDMIVGNEEEFATLADSCRSGQDLARQLGETRPVIFKRGEKGSVTYCGAQAIETDVYPVDAIKPTGSGDAFLGNLLAALASGHGLNEALRRGSAAAAIVVSRVGCAPAMPGPDELASFIQKREASHAHSTP